MAYRSYLMVCAGTGCVANQSIKLKEKLVDEIRKKGLQDEVAVVTTGCNGFCAVGPLMVVQPDGIFYQLLKEGDIPHLVEEHFIKGRPVKQLMYTPVNANVPIPKMAQIPFFADQVPVVLRNRGIINPESIEEYIARGGYEALAKVLTSMAPMDVINEIKASGLRGRGGGGFPTGIKWEACRNMPGDVRYIVCNADEGDPGAFMDRSVLEGDPHSVLEGMIIGAYAIGASFGYIYCRAEYPLAVKRLNIAIQQARDKGYLGLDILGIEGFNFDIVVKEGAGAFVCGEETALIASIEGERGMPRKRPPFPAVSGLWKRPTNINNVETFANIPWIIINGAAAYAKYGTEKSKGTKVFALTGKIKNGGLVEVPMGITIKDIIYKLGGGIIDDKKFKAVQLGGPSGGCIPEYLSHTIVDYDSVNATGAIMGSGGMVVMDETTCMVDIARFFLDFTQKESCGKCTFCRIGTKRMLEILTRITEGEGREGDIEKLEELSYQIKDGSLCGLGQTAPNPVLTTLKYFRDEYEAHIRDKKCPALNCKKLLTYEIIPDKCTGCMVCKKGCPTKAIEGERKQIHIIHQNLCIKCGDCFAKCKFDSIKIF